MQWVVVLKWDSIKCSAKLFSVKFQQKGLTEIKSKVLSKELYKYHPCSKKHRNSDENTFFKNSPTPPFYSGGGLLFGHLDVTNELNTWKQFAGWRRGYWFSQRVCTGKILLFNSVCGWFLPHTTLNQEDWMKYINSCFV